MSTTRYKGFSIEARPYQTQVSRQWTVDLEIHRNGRKKPFSLNQHYPTQREADDRCSRLGRQIIDGGIAGWSVESLRPTGFLRGYRDGHRHRLAGAGKLMLEIAIIVIVAFGAIAFLSGAFRTP